MDQVDRQMADPKQCPGAETQTRTQESHRLGLVMTHWLLLGHTALLLGLRAGREADLHQAHGHAREAAKAKPPPVAPRTFLEVCRVRASLSTSPAALPVDLCLLFDPLPQPFPELAPLCVPSTQPPHLSVVSVCPGELVMTLGSHSVCLWLAQ